MFRFLQFLLVIAAWSELRLSQALSLKESRHVLQDHSSEGPIPAPPNPAGSPDPTCLKGLPDAPQKTCCSPKCWTCGSHAMCSDPKKFMQIVGNNVSDCCDSVIAVGERKCETHAAPCIISNEVRAQIKKELMLPINDERHARNKAVIKQRQFRFILYYEVKVAYDHATDIARDVKTLSDLMVDKALKNVDKFKAKLEAAGHPYVPEEYFLQLAHNETGPINEGLWRTQVELNEDEARFYRQISRNARFLMNNASEGLARVDEMKVKVQTNLDKIHSYQGEVNDLSKDAVRLDHEAKVLWKQWKNNAKNYNCTPIPVVEHAANEIAQPRTDIRRVHVECKAGYDSKESKNSLRCLKQGDYGKELYGALQGVATCVGRNCGKPPEVKAATTVVQDIIYPNKATYTCFEGHSMNGKASGPKAFEVPCTTKGKLDFKAHEHKCDPVRCGPALKIDNSHPVGGSFHFAQVVVHKCMEGYTIDAAAAGLKEFEVSCLGTGEFSAAQKCRAVACGPTPTFDNTKLLTSGDDQFYPSVSKYECEKGYTIDVDQNPAGPITYSLQCAPSGEFVVHGKEGAALPQCRPVSAGMAPQVKYGNYQNRVMYYGESAVVGAENGYSHLSEAGKGVNFELVVTPEGKYSGLKEFKPVRCGPAPNIVQAKTSFSKAQAVYKDLLDYECTKGYSVDASSAPARQKFTLLCQADGTLSRVPGDAGECVNIDDCASHTCGPFGKCVDKLLNYSCVCNDGYEEQYDKERDERTCGNIDDCGPEACGVGECKDGLNDYECICPDGYEVKVTAEGDTCAKVTCGTPPRVEFAITKPAGAQSTKQYFQGKVLYECSEGYTLDGSAGGKQNFEITCQADKSFTASGQCKPVECGAAPDVAHTNKEPDSAVFNEEVKYECLEGYSIDGTPEGDKHFKVGCQANGKYGQALSCQKVICGEPDQVANAQRPSGKLKFGDSVKYQCFNGYTIDGHRDSATTFSQECQANGKLEPGLETCNPKICGEPPQKINVLHASVPDMGNVRYPGVVEVTCRDGYTVGGDPKGKSSFVIKCQADGHFERYDERECMPVVCGPPPSLPNATLEDIVVAKDHSQSDSKVMTFGLQANYKCKVGFTAGGELDAKPKVKAECLANGQMSIPPDDLMCRNFDDCTKHSCGKRGTCVDLIGPSPSYTCKCEPGFEIRDLGGGEKFCGNIDDCPGADCGPGVCQDLVKGYTCVCPAGHYLADTKDGGKTCLPVECAPEAPQVANAEREDQHSGAVVYPTTLRWKCKEGYSTDQSAAEAKFEFQASCKAHGKLHGMMQCLPITCGTPHMFVHTDLVFPANKRQILQFPQKAKYKCKEGYTIQGAPDGKNEFEAACKPDGVMGDPEVCEPVKCGKAPRMEKCRASVAGDVTYGMDVQYECDKGYTLTGQAGGKHHFHRKCLKSGEFEEAEGECKPVLAVGGGKLPKVEGAKAVQYDGKEIEDVDKIVAKYPDGMEFKCLPGHSLNGGLDGQVKFISAVNSLGNFVPALPAKCKPITFQLQGEVKNAPTGAPLNGAKVELVGGGFVETQGGFFTIKDLKPGKIKLKYSKSGFISAEKEFDMAGNMEAGGPADISMSPMMAPSEWRSVVKWGDYPTDLDTYLKWGQNSVNWQETYVDSTFIGKLEVDDTDGFGPETVHMQRVGTCDGPAAKCDLKYMINDYDETGELEEYGATVTLYHGEKVEGEWNVKDCPGSVSDDGNWWHVYTIDGKNNKLKWHCGQQAMLLNVGPLQNVSMSAKLINQDFENYVGPFPGRFQRGKRFQQRFQHAAGIQRHGSLRAKAHK